VFEIRCHFSASNVESSLSFVTLRRLSMGNPKPGKKRFVGGKYISVWFVKGDGQRYTFKIEIDFSEIRMHQFGFAQYEVQSVSVRQAGLWSNQNAQQWFLSLFNLNFFRKLALIIFSSLIAKVSFSFEMIFNFIESAFVGLHTLNCFLPSTLIAFVLYFNNSYIFS